MFKIIAERRRNEHVVKFEGDKIKTKNSVVDKEKSKETSVVKKTTNERVTAKYLGKRKIEVTVKDGGRIASRIYKESLNVDKSSRRVKEVAHNFCHEDGINVTEKEVYDAITKLINGLSGVHFVALIQE